MLVISAILNVIAVGAILAMYEEIRHLKAIALLQQAIIMDEEKSYVIRGKI